MLASVTLSWDFAGGRTAPDGESLLVSLYVDEGGHSAATQLGVSRLILD